MSSEEALSKALGASHGSGKVSCWLLCKLSAKVLGFLILHLVAGLPVAIARALCHAGDVTKPTCCAWEDE